MPQPDPLCNRRYLRTLADAALAPPACTEAFAAGQQMALPEALATLLVASPKAAM